MNGAKIQESAVRPIFEKVEKILYPTWLVQENALFRKCKIRNLRYSILQGCFALLIKFRLKFDQSLYHEAWCGIISLHGTNSGSGLSLCHVSWFFPLWKTGLALRKTYIFLREKANFLLLEKWLSSRHLKAFSFMKWMKPFVFIFILISDLPYEAKSVILKSSRNHRSVQAFVHFQKCTNGTAVRPKLDLAFIGWKFIKLDLFLRLFTKVNCSETVQCQPNFNFCIKVKLLLLVQIQAKTYKFWNCTNNGHFD